MKIVILFHKRSFYLSTQIHQTVIRFYLSFAILCKGDSQTLIFFFNFNYPYLITSIIDYQNEQQHNIGFQSY